MATAPRLGEPPFGTLPAPARRRLIGMTLLGVAVLGVVMLQVGRPMDEGGHDIVAFELARTPERAAEIMDDWGEDGRQAARHQTWLDYGWLVLYATCLAAALSHLAVGAERRLRVVASAAAWGALVAGVFDAVENTALLAVLDGRSGSLPAVAFAFASGKFALLAVGVAVLLGGVAVRAMSARSNPA